MKNAKIKIRKGDTVRIMVGKDRGREGKVEKVGVSQGLVFVPGINQYKKHVKPKGEKAGEIMTLSRPVAVAKVAVICPKCKKATRVGFKLEGEVKIRVCRKCGGNL